MPQKQPNITKTRTNSRTVNKASAAKATTAVTIGKTGIHQQQQQQQQQQQFFKRIELRE